MNEKGEKTCPLCAEEMDLTDQHLKPCKCGYQVGYITTTYPQMWLLLDLFFCLLFLVTV